MKSKKSIKVQIPHLFLIVEKKTGKDTKPLYNMKKSSFTTKNRAISSLKLSIELNNNIAPFYKYDYVEKKLSDFVILEYTADGVIQHEVE